MDDDDPLEVIYVRIRRSVKNDVEKAAREDLRSKAKEVAHLIELGLAVRAAQKQGPGTA